MPFENLYPEGTVLAGAPANTVTPEGIMREDMVPESDWMTRLAKTLYARVDEMKARQEEQQKKMANQASMYKTLRDSGYTPKAAYEAVIKKQFPEVAPEETLDEQKKRADIRYTKAQTIKTKIDAAKSRRGTLTTNILNKVAQDQELTPGEQKVYDEYIRKYGNKSDLQEYLDKKAAEEAAAEEAAGGEGEYVKMLDPQGKKVKVLKGAVNQKIKEGYKRR